MFSTDIEDSRQEMHTGIDRNRTEQKVSRQTLYLLLSKTSKL